MQIHFMRQMVEPGPHRADQPSLRPAGCEVVGEQLSPSQGVTRHDLPQFQYKGNE